MANLPLELAVVYSAANKRQRPHLGVDYSALRNQPSRLVVCLDLLPLRNRVVVYSVLLLLLSRRVAVCSGLHLNRLSNQADCSAPRLRLRAPVGCSGPLHPLQLQRPPDCSDLLLLLQVEACSAHPPRQPLRLAAGYSDQLLPLPEVVCSDRRRQLLRPLVAASSGHPLVPLSLHRLGVYSDHRLLLPLRQPEVDCLGQRQLLPQHPLAACSGLPDQLLRLQLPVEVSSELPPPHQPLRQQVSSEPLLLPRLLLRRAGCSGQPLLQLLLLRAADCSGQQQQPLLRHLREVYSGAAPQLRLPPVASSGLPPRQRPLNQQPVVVCSGHQPLSLQLRVVFSDRRRRPPRPQREHRPCLVSRRRRLSLRQEAVCLERPPLRGLPAACLDPRRRLLQRLPLPGSVRSRPTCSSTDQLTSSLPAGRAGLPNKRQCFRSSHRTSYRSTSSSSSRPGG